MDKIPTAALMSTQIESMQCTFKSTFWGKKGIFFYIGILEMIKYLIFFNHNFTPKSPDCLMFFTVIFQFLVLFCEFSDISRQYSPVHNFSSHCLVPIQSLLKKQILLTGFESSRQLFFLAYSLNPLYCFFKL